MRIALALDVRLASLFGEDDAPPDLRLLLRAPDTRVIYGGRELSDREKERILAILDAALALRDEAEEAAPGTAQPRSPVIQGPIAASMAEREVYGRHDPALNAFLHDVIQKALEEYDRKHRRGGPDRRES